MTNRRTAIVTGAAKGIGKAIAIKLLQNDFNVVLNYLKDDEAMEKLLSETMQHKDQILVCKADVSNRIQIQQMLAKVIARFNSIDCLVNNAGLNIDRPFIDMSDNDWEKVVDINMKGVFIMSQETSFQMLKQADGGKIVNISATTAIKGRKNGINYCASKAGVLVMTKCMALELAPKITVNCVIPGFTLTDETKERFDLPNRLEEEMSKRNIPAGRMGETGEIASVVYFLLTGEASYINGQKIIVDGGEYMF